MFISPFCLENNLEEIKVQVMKIVVRKWRLIASFLSYYQKFNFLFSLMIRYINDY